jgi:hypothetical protein
LSLAAGKTCSYGDGENPQPADPLFTRQADSRATGKATAFACPEGAARPTAWTREAGSLPIKEKIAIALDIPPPGAGAVEPPSPYAELTVQLGPAQRWGSARGKVPPEQAHHLITTFGIVSSVIAGIAGSVLTLRIAAGLTVAACAELGVALAAAALIASRRAVTRAGRPQALPEARERT